MPLKVDQIDKEKEDYAFRIGCVESLRRAREILIASKEADQKSVLTIAAIEFALIEYAKSFKRSDGKFSSYRLPSDYISDEFQAIHGKILALRDQVLAHADLTVKDIHVDFWKSEHGDISFISESVVFPMYEVGGQNAVIDLVNGVLKRLEEECHQLQEKFHRDPTVTGA